MPGGDGTGPMGMGPMTGRAAGFCAGYNVPGTVNPVGGRGFGRGFGGGFGRGGGGWGRRNMFYATDLTGWQRAGLGWGGAVPPAGVPFAAPTKEQQVEALKTQAEAMENGLKDIKSRIDELEKEAK